MENKDFDKIFAHKFGQLPGEPYREEGWSDLSTRLDAHNGKHRNWVLPIIFPLFGLLIASNVFWWHQWREASKGSQASGDQMAIFQTDTLVQTAVIYRHDTIYKYITLVPGQSASKLPSFEQTVATDVPNTNLLYARPISLGNTTIHQDTSDGKPPALQEDDNLTQQGTLAATIAQDTIKQQFIHDNAAVIGRAIVHKVPVVDTPALTDQPRVSPEATAADSVFEQLLKTPATTKKAHSHLFYLARPRAGLSVGWGSPVLRHKRSGSMFGIGIGADVEIARNVRLGTEIHYWKGKLKADEADALRGVEIPNPGSDYKLRYWETYELPAVTYTFQLRYHIPLKKKWSPWIGLGTQVATLLPFEVEFDFENQNNNLEIFLPGQTKAITHWQGMLAMLGVEGQLGPRFSVGVEGYLLQHLGKNPGILDDQLGLKARLYYIF